MTKNISEIKTDLHFLYLGQERQARDLLIKEGVLDITAIAQMTSTEVEGYINKNYAVFVAVDDSRRETLYLFRKDSPIEAVVLSR